MHAESYLSRINDKLNPPKRVIDWWERSHPRVSDIMKFPAENGQPAMTARLNKPYSLSEQELYRIASASVEGERLWGADSLARDLTPARSRVNETMEGLRGKHLITVWDDSGNLIGGSTLGLKAPESMTQGLLPIAPEHSGQRGTAYLSDVFWTSENGWSPVVKAAETLAAERGARALALDPALPVRLPIDSQRSPWQQVSWFGRDHVSPAFERARSGVGSVTGAVTDVIGRPLRPVADAGSWIGAHLNPYSHPRGVEPTALRQGFQDAGNFLRYSVREGVDAGRGATLLMLGPQAATGNVEVAVNDPRTVRPFNGLPGHSVALYFPYSGTMITLWGNGPNLRGPAPFFEDGLQPQARIRPAVHDPQGPNGAGVLSTVRLLFPGEVNLGIRYLGSNDGFSAQSALSMRFGRLNNSVRADIPVQAGGPKGLSLISSLTAFAPSMSHAFFFGPVGVTVRGMRVNQIGLAQTAPIDMAARGTGYRSGDHYTLGGLRVSGGSGFYFTLNPAYGDPEFKPR